MHPLTDQRSERPACHDDWTFRTEWAGGSLKQVQNPLPDYEDNVGARRALIVSMFDKLPGDPRRAGQAIVDLYDLPDPPSPPTIQMLRRTR